MDSLWATPATIHTDLSDYSFMPRMGTHCEAPDQVSQFDITRLVLWC
jgi:hypothetical protein